MIANAVALATSTIVPKIGRGRKEADAIGPVQRELYALIASIKRGIDTATPEQLARWRAELADGWAQFVDFIYQSAFTADGDTRASDQAFGDVRVYVEGKTAGGRDVTVHPNPDLGGLGTTVPPGGWLGELNRRIGNMAIDWGQIINRSIDTVDRIVRPDAGRVVYDEYGQPRYYDPYGTQIEVTAPYPDGGFDLEDVPTWVWVVGGLAVGGVAISLLKN